MPTAKVKIPEVVMAEMGRFAAKYNWHNLPEMVKYVPEGYNFTGYNRGCDTIGVVREKSPRNGIVFKKQRLTPNIPLKKWTVLLY
jgi:hypothetical protein